MRGQWTGVLDTFDQEEHWRNDIDRRYDVIHKYTIDMPSTNQVGKLTSHDILLFRKAQIIHDQCTGKTIIMYACFNFVLSC